MPRRTSVLRGAARALPIVLGYIPIGLAFGVLAHEAGLSTGAVFGMSVILYAGSAQFLAVGMLAGGAGFLPIAAATFFINLRHFLMSAALSPHLRRYDPISLAPLAYELTDESFAVHSAGFQAGLDPTYPEMLALNATAQVSWVASTTLGALAGNLIPDAAAFGFDFALPAMFIGLLAAQVEKGRRILVAALAGALAVVLAGALPDNWNIIGAAVAAATIGAAFR